MDLVSIKRNIDNASIRTTSEFQRDMMLMFTNAIMYNSANHDVFKMATEMYDDVMMHIEVSIKVNESRSVWGTKSRSVYSRVTERRSVWGH